MSPQAQSTGLSESGQFTQSGPASDSSLPSGEGITLLLDDFSASLSSLKTASERSQSSPAPSLADGSGPSGSRAQPGSQRRPSAGAPLDRRSPNRSRPGSRSISRPSLASVNSLLLHPSLLHPIGERRASSIRYPGGSANVSPTTSSPEDITLSGLPSSLGTSRSQHVSQLPSFPESARMLSPDFPSSARLSESPTTPDPLDNMVLADDTGGALPYKRNVLTVMRKSSGAIDLDVPESGEVFSPAQSTPSTASGNKQTFPETPNAMSPTFSPGVTSVHGTALPSANPLGLRSGSIHRSMRGRANRKSERLLIGRSVSSRTLSSGVRPRKRSIKSKLSRTSVASSAYALSEEGSSVPPTEGEAPARQLDVEKSSPTVSATSHRRTGSVKVSSSIPPVPLAVPPPPPLASPRISSDEQPGNATPAPQQLPPPPPPPQLLPAPHSHSHSHPPTQALVPPPPPPPHVLSSPPAHPRSSPTPPPSFESSSTDSHQNRAPPPPYQYLTPSPTVPPPHFLPNIPPPPPLPSQANVFGQANARRTQSRPPLPAGPRTRNRNASSASVPTREQLGVNSSAESLGRPLLPGRITRSQSISSSSGPSSGPKFQTSPTKFKGLTMEAAKWTFSSEELQSVVSKAIRQSGEASSIRLLPPRVAHTDLPDELEHTIALQNELKVQYRLQARKRDALLAALTAHAEGQEINPHTVRSKLDDLRDISANMDRITEGLYHARDQAAQLSQLLSVHSASALAMALRKLNTSFLKRSAEVQGLHQHISALEAERDEAWAQAQQVARDLDDLNDTLQTQDNNASLTRSASSRSSRVVASRKSSIRASKAGLRRGSRSQRVSSTASQLGSGRLSYMSSGTPSLSPGVIPPVPPIPRRVSSLGRIITTDLSSARYSAYTSTLSSSSETRALALAEAQAELYGILGIEDPELKPPTSLRRSITISGSSSTTPSSAVQLTRRMSDIGDTRLTRSGGIFERLQALEHVESGPDAVLAVLKLMDP
ncbi:hypothetical protein BC834DRAFT_77256 [Gloeopeniophorella convolvens]|nr:hypothetical protein BC834DRAFT_77256 [Gloeopeniophorella convolvens]